jgi:iron complex outermembrane receptor protein
MKDRCAWFVLASLVAPYCGVAATASDALDEVVVTAQRRTERLQDVPAAITALSGDSLNQMHLQGNADLAGKVPSLAFDVQGPGESTLSIRGIGTSYGLAPAVSYYINETPLDIRTDGLSGVPDIDFFDVDRVEVLRGPQGTLYGSSSMGGALRILTAQPDPKAFGVNAEIGGSTTEGGGAGYLAKSAVNLPLSTDSAIRIVGTYEHIAGYINRATPSDYSVAQPNDPVTARRINDADVKSGRIIGLWQPMDELTIKPSIMFSEIDAGSVSKYYSNLPDFTAGAFYASPSTSKLVIGNLLVEGDLGFAKLMSSTSVLTRNVDSHNDFSLLIANLAPAFGLSQTPIYPETDFLTSHNSGFVQELRFTSPAEDRLRWVAGLYFSRYRQHSEEFDDSESFATKIGQTTGGNLYTFDQTLVDQQVAAFADLTYRVLPRFEISAGARYYELRDSLENTQSGVLAAPSQPLVHAKASGTSPRIVLTYHPDVDATIYATAAKGYRPGGPNVGLPTNLGCTLANAYPSLYEPDSVWNYELGAKTEWWQHRLTVDVAVYRIDWKGVQQSVTDPGCGSLFVANVGDAVTKGAELEINFKPLDSLLLSAGGSYMHAEFTSIAGPFQSASTVQAGDAVPDVPRQKFDVSGEYSIPVGGQLTGFIRSDWTHLGSVPTGFTYHDTRPAYSSVGAAVGLRSSRYEASLYGRNLANANGILEIQEGGTLSFGNVFRSQISIPPRVVGIDLKMHF